MEDEERTEHPAPPRADWPSQSRSDWPSQSRSDWPSQSRSHDAEPEAAPERRDPRTISGGGLRGPDPRQRHTRDRRVQRPV